MFLTSEVDKLINWSAETFPIALEKFAFFEEFDGIVVSGEEKMIKPDKQFFQVMLDRYKFNATNFLFIHENLKNIAAAKDLGFTTIHITENTILLNVLTALGLPG